MTTSKEFLRWRLYLDQQPNEFNATHYYLALIAMMIAKVNTKNPEKIKLEDFLLEFEQRGKEKVKGPVSPEIAAIRKRMFLSSLGVGISPEVKIKTQKRSTQPHKTQKKKK